jgi:hypothetical protein
MRFILLRGLLREGLIFATVLTFGPILYDLLIHHVKLPPLWDTMRGFIILTLVIGYGMGELLWRKGEEDYKKSNEFDS